MAKGKDANVLPFARKEPRPAKRGRPRKNNVVEFTGITRLDKPPERILNGALEVGLSEVVIVGFTSEGDYYFASSQADAAPILFHLEMAKRRLLNVCDPQEGDDE